MSKKYIKVGIIAILVMFASFYLLHGIIGRNGKFNPDYYVTMYAGGPIKLFDMYVEKPVKKSNIIGKETFHSINSLLYKLKIVKTKYIKHLEFRRYNGLFLGNIYTPFRRYYADFGLVGMIILTSIVAILMNFFYLFSMNKIKNGHDLWMACYGLIIYGLFLYSINDEFFNVIFSVNYASLYILLIGFYFIYTRIIRKKWNR